MTAFNTGLQITENLTVDSWKFTQPCLGQHQCAPICILTWHTEKRSVLLQPWTSLPLLLRSVWFFSFPWVKYYICIVFYFHLVNSTDYSTLSITPQIPILSPHISVISVLSSFGSSPHLMKEAFFILIRKKNLLRQSQGQYQWPWK